jgi:hypothetical protein
MQTRDDGYYTSFRDMYISKKSIMLQSFPYKQSDYNYIAGIHLQKAGKSIVYSTILTLLSSGVAVLVNDKLVRGTAITLGAISFTIGASYTGYHLKSAGNLQQLAAEKTW